jgi:hypothetical protein
LFRGLLFVPSTSEILMDNLARPDFAKANPANDFGVSLSALIDAEGSLDAIKAISKFLKDSRDSSDLRSSVKTQRPALIADIAHFLCISHGRHPGIVDHAATKIIEEPAREWLVQAIDGFAAERGYLNQLTVAAGPIARQTGQEKITAIITNQSKSFEMLATSDRKGCAAGAAIAFVLDWQNTRDILDECGLSLGIQPSKLGLPNRLESISLANALTPDIAKQRAMMFGAQQMLAQQRGLWQLIAARHVEMQNTGA